MTTLQCSRIQSALKALGLPGWLLYSFRDSNPIATRLLGLTPAVHQSRRWAFLIPAEGAPRGLVHRIEPHIGEYMAGEVERYSTHQEFAAGLFRMLEGLDSVAMEYSPNNALPVVSRVDGGTLELVRSLGVGVVSSGGLIAQMEAVLSEEQIESAKRAGAAVREIMMNAFRFIGAQLETGKRVDEFGVVQYILGEFSHHNLMTDHSPNCSVGPNSANPHYEPTEGNCAEIRRGDFVLIDLWAREPEEGRVYGDITWVGYAGSEVPEEHTNVFNVVRDARDAAFRSVKEAFARNATVTGAELDDVAREVINAAGYGDYFIHRTGHSITTELHGAGANLDNYETIDARPILAGTSFSIEPGIYLPGRFGIRSELDVVITHEGEVLATSEPLQSGIIPILK